MADMKLEDHVLPWEFRTVGVGLHKGAPAEDVDFLMQKLCDWLNAILATSGLVPWVSANVLSDFYNRTKSRYYMRLSEASRHDDVMGFVAYSAQGFRDELRSQVEAVQDQQRIVAWINYVHERTWNKHASSR